MAALRETGARSPANGAQRAAAGAPRAGAILAILAALLASIASSPSIAAAQGPSAPPGPSAEPRARIEARSSDLLAVGTVQGDRMTVRLSQVVDNAPVGNAVVAVMLRGSTHPAVAEADGSYSIETKDLDLPGPAAVELLVSWGEKREELTGTLTALKDQGSSGDKSGNARQLGWWVLNFAACIGFLWLWSRRRRKSDDG